MLYFPASKTLRKYKKKGNQQICIIILILLLGFTIMIKIWYKFGGVISFDEVPNFDLKMLEWQEDDPR